MARGVRRPTPQQADLDGRLRKLEVSLGIDTQSQELPAGHERLDSTYSLVPQDEGGCTSNVSDEQGHPAVANRQDQPDGVLGDDMAHRATGLERLNTDVVRQAAAIAYNWALRAPVVTDIWVMFAETKPPPNGVHLQASVFRIYGQVLAWNEVPTWIIPGAQERVAALNPPLIGLWLRYCEIGEVGVDRPARVVLHFTPGDGDINVYLEWRDDCVRHPTLSPVDVFQLWLQRLRETGDGSAQFMPVEPALKAAPVGTAVEETTRPAVSSKPADPRPDCGLKPRDRLAPVKTTAAGDATTEGATKPATTSTELGDPRPEFGLNVGGRPVPNPRPGSLGRNDLPSPLQPSPSLGALPNPPEPYASAFRRVFGALAVDIVQAAWDWTGPSPDIETIWICLTDTAGVPASTVMFCLRGRILTPAEVGGVSTPDVLASGTLEEWRAAVPAGPVGIHHPGMVVIRGDLRTSQCGVDQVRWGQVADGDVERWVEGLKEASSSASAPSHSMESTPPSTSSPPPQLQHSKSLPTPPPPTSSPTLPTSSRRTSLISPSSPVPQDDKKAAFLTRFEPSLATTLRKTLAWPINRRQVATIWVYMAHVGSTAAVGILMDDGNGTSLAALGGRDPAPLLDCIGCAWLQTCLAGTPDVDHPRAMVIIVRPNAGPSLTVETTWDGEGVDWPDMPASAVWRQDVL